MASDSLRQVGRYIKQANRNSDLALKRYAKHMPTRERARDTVSSVYPFRMTIFTEGGNDTVTIDINFNKPPPDSCTSDCISTACEGFDLLRGGHSISLVNQYEAGTVTVYSQGNALSSVNWYEESPEAGQVYVQVVNNIEKIVICYSYIVC